MDRKITVRWGRQVAAVMAGTLLTACAHRLRAEEVPQDVQQLIRVLRYEVYVGKPLTAETGLCLDQRLGARTSTWASDGAKPSPSQMALISSTAAACAKDTAVATDLPPAFQAPTRSVALEAPLVKAGRGWLQGLQAFAAKRQLLEPCWRQAKEFEAFLGCYANSTGALPGAGEQAQWAALFQTRNQAP
jgi:hypothetical protein